MVQLLIVLQDRFAPEAEARREEQRTMNGFLLNKLERERGEHEETRKKLADTKYRLERLQDEVWRLERKAAIAAVGSEKKRGRSSDADRSSNSRASKGQRR